MRATITQPGAQLARRLIAAGQLSIARYVPPNFNCKDHEVVAIEGVPDWKAASTQCDLKALMTAERMKTVGLDIQARSVAPKRKNP